MTTELKLESSHKCTFENEGGFEKYTFDQKTLKLPNIIKKLFEHYHFPQSNMSSFMVVLDLTCLASIIFFLAKSPNCCTRTS